MTETHKYYKSEHFTIYAITTNKKIEQWAYETERDYVEGFKNAEDAINAATEATKDFT